MTYPDIAPPSFDAIPVELKALDQWVAWRLETPPGRPKQTKVPYDPRTGGKADSTDAATWAAFDRAFAAYQGGTYTGIGFVFSPDDVYAGIDLDGCRNPLTEEIAAWALTIIQRFNSYTEISPSGTGVKIFVQASHPGHGFRKELKDGCAIEMYDAGRYFTTTGSHLPITPTSITAGHDEFCTLHQEIFGAKPTAPKPVSRSMQSALPADSELLDKARASSDGKFKALYDGGWEMAGYGSQSSADLALCGRLSFWTGGDFGRMDSLFRSSALMRDKWDERRGTQTYGQRTLNFALIGRTDFYTPPGMKMIERGQKAAQAAVNHAAADEKAAASEDAAKAEGDAAPQPSEARTAELALTDIGNGQRLAERHGRDLRFCHAWDKWLIWDSQRFRLDDTGEIDRRAKETAQHIYQEAADCPDTARQTELAKHALRSQSHARVQSMIALANSEPGIPSRPGDWDKRPWLLACGNGTIDLKTGRLQKSRRGDMGTKCAGTEYDPEAAAPRWEAFLETVLPDASLRGFFQRFIGYALTGDVSEQCLGFLYGSGSNGKSTALRAIMDTLGDYALQAAPDLLIARESAGGPNNDVAELQGTRLVATIEVEDGKRMAEGLVKQITGGDRIKARYMRQDFFEFEPTHKILLAANHKPTIRGQDFAIWRRIKVIPFEVQIADGDKDPHLPEKLRAEMPGILAWAVRGCLEWQKSGLAEPAAVKEATAAYQAGEDVLGDFLGECCLLRPSLKVTAATLYVAYVKWAEDNSERALSKKNFGSRLQEGRRIFPGQNIGPKNARGWEGVGLIDTESAAIFGEVDKIDKSDPQIPISSQLKEPREDNPEITSNLSILSTNEKAEDDDFEVIL